MIIQEELRLVGRSWFFADLLLAKHAITTLDFTIAVLHKGMQNPPNPKYSISRYLDGGYGKYLNTRDRHNQIMQPTVTACHDTDFAQTMRPKSCPVFHKSGRRHGKCASTSILRL